MNDEQNVLVYAEGWYSGLIQHVQSLRHYSPGARIHLIHDQIALDQLGAASVSVDEQILIGSYCASSADFLSRYTWSGSNSYEAACCSYRRHYVLLEYAKAAGLKNFWYFDWDVLVFCDLKEKAALFSGFKGLRRCGNFYVNDVGFFEYYLEAWKEHPLITSTDQPNTEQFVELSLFTDTDIGRYYANSNDILVDGTCFDGNISLADSGFLVVEGKNPEDGTKMLLFKEAAGKRYPYAYHTVEHRWIKMNTIHCWGSHKFKPDLYLRMALAP